MFIRSGSYYSMMKLSNSLESVSWTLFSVRIRSIRIRILRTLLLSKQLNIPIKLVYIHL